ncbi:YadA C-terminal domain-containing protein [Rahnella laticis]|uniref:YadA C-terminal domain-containing protein n=1 Tax=Rahnella laticis TaxID=2787622 RepID=UPI001E5E6961|nr:YadA C-terminal domain-containing protein [Rahnella laticis]
MKAQTTDRNTQIVNAYIAGNHNKTELARYFGVSAAVTCRVIAAIAIFASVIPLAQASLLDDFNKGMDYKTFAAEWEGLTLAQQQAEREIFRDAGKENILSDLGINEAIHAPDVTTPSASDENLSQPTPHLDSDVSQAERDHAQLQAAVEHANSLTNGKNGTDGKNTQSQIATQQQITALNAEAEQNHAEVLSESHARFQADKQVLSESESYTNQKFSDLKSQVDDNKKEAAAGSASAMAQANIPQVQESQQFAVGAGIGGYDSENALSVGASFHAGQATIVKMSVSDDSQSNVGYGAGVSVGW